MILTPRSLLLLAFTLAACSPEPSPSRTCTTSSQCGSDEICIDSRCQGRNDAGNIDTGSTMRDGMVPDVPPASITGLRIEPAEATVVGAPGDHPTQRFEVFAMLDDGGEVSLPSSQFSLDSLAVGDIDPGSGVFTANGGTGGTSRVRGTLTDRPDLEAFATVTVRLEATLLGTGVPGDAASRFETLIEDDARRADLVYPLDGAVMPQNVYPANLQWLVGSDVDLYRVRLTKTHYALTAIITTDDRAWLVDQTSWRALARTDPDEDAVITVDRLDGAEAIAGRPVRIRFAPTSLIGSVYYWDIAAGQILRIDDGTGEATQFMPTPPLDRTSESRCVGCHTVSNSGRYMAGRLGGGRNIGAVFDLTSELSGAEPPTEYALDRTTEAHWWTFSSWSPDDSRLVLSHDIETATTGLSFMDPFTGSIVPVTGVSPLYVSQPAWSPDGEQIAYVANINAWGGQFVQGDIGTLDVTGPDTLGSNRIIHAGSALMDSSPPGNADSYPTWTPDSRHIAFSHGSGTRSDDQNAALYLMNRSGGAVVRLDAANGESTGNFQPRFSPFEGAGYFWMSFLSKRDYGNSEVGTRGGARQQIWVAAVRTDPVPGEDPSAVGYWLPGQRASTRNISAYWAPRPCREDGEACGVGSECCGGDCRPDGDGALVCSPPPPERCRTEEETCGSDEDCCGDLTCYMHVCIQSIL